VLGLRESKFIDKYLTIDQEGDYVLISKPCPFLGDDNFCSIYEDRPSDCKRFPYTDEDVFIKRPVITLKNSSFCPAVYFVLEKLTAQLGQ
jgi:Fe-S-cluster containining protein